MEDKASEMIKNFKEKIDALLSDSYSTEFKKVMAENGLQKSQIRPKTLSKIFQLIADSSCTDSRRNEDNGYLNKGVSSLAEELLQSKSISILDFLECLHNFLGNVESFEIPKESKSMSEKLNELLETKLCHLRILAVLVKSFMKCYCDCDASFGETTDAIKNNFLQTVFLLLEILQIPKSSDFKDVCILDSENMKVYSNIVETGLEALQKMLVVRDVIMEDDEKSMQSFVDAEKCKVVSYIIKKSAVEILCLALANFGNHAWTSKSLKQKSESILCHFCRITKTNGLENLLVGDELSSGNCEIVMFPHGLIAPLLKEVHSRFKNNGWKQDPSVKHILLHSVMNVKYPNLKDHIGILIPMLIEMLEDYKCENQILGIGCLEYLIDNVNPSDLNLYNHGELLYNVLFKQLYGVKGETLKILLPCLRKVLYVIEAFPERVNVSDITSKWDEAVRQLITNMEYESKVQERRILAENLKYFINPLGINCIKHLKSLLRLTSHYLEFHDGEDEIVRVHSLEIMRNCILCCWPVMSEHVGGILKVILRLIVDVNIKDSFTSKKARIVLENLALNIVKLLKQCCGNDDVDKYLKAALDAKFDESFCSVKKFIEDSIKLETLNELATAQ